jgi:YGGT family
VAIEQVDKTTVTQAPVAGADEATVRTDTHRISRMSPGRNETARRIVVLVFGLIQLVIGARIVLLLLDAREANPIVSAILNVSQIFVAPFEGVLGTDSLNAAGSVLDIAAVVALVGWTIVELIVIWALGIFRREPV